MKRVLVVGGGIAGLGTAQALLRQGIDCDVVERSNGWEHTGTGMYLPANSVRALEVLGLRDHVLDRGRVIARQRFLDERGRQLLDVDLHKFWGATGPCIALERGALHDVLREGLTVRLATRVVALRQEGERVHATFDDGSSGYYDLLAGADGVRSWVRTAAFNGAEPHFLGQASWRLFADGFPDLTAWSAWLGPGRSFLAIPLGAGRIYCYADLDAADGTDPTSGDPLALTALYSQFAEPVPTIIAAGLAKGNSPYYSPIEEVVQQPWVRRRIVLVGDAAHAMSPNMAEGAGMALEDAIVLAETITSGLPLEDFETRRRPRVAFVQAQTLRRDHTRRLPRQVRDAALRFAGQRIFRSNYAPLRAAP